MSYRPLQAGLAPALIGAMDTSQYFDSRQTKGKSIGKSIIMVIISGIVFITLLSFFEVIRTWVNRYYVRQRFNGTESVLILAENSVSTALFFAAICLVISLFFIPLLLYFLYLKSC